ncbi:MAG: hypothetical protein DWQ42_15765 [Planctomycetota bacterium]|nr:MAG: hypothetical protein DWQ42_15765 [Planctomycetota bacterium]REK49367.1 MAG: hypothetical protein DWQ46_00445 [Planctomycetota bacterium]
MERALFGDEKGAAALVVLVQVVGVREQQLPFTRRTGGVAYDMFDELQSSLERVGVVALLSSSIT